MTRIIIELIECSEGVAGLVQAKGCGSTPKEREMAEKIGDFAKSLLLAQQKEDEKGQWIQAEWRKDAKS